MARIRKSGNEEAITWKVGLYIRLSKEDLAKKEESLSIANQRELLRDFLAKHPELHFYKEYVDDGVSGASDDRRGFSQLTRDIEDHKVNCFLTKDLSRFARNSHMAGYYLEDFFVRHRVRFITVSGSCPLDSYLNPEMMKSLLIPMENLQNAYFIKETSRKIREVLYSKKAKGLYTGSFAPYGYLRCPEHKHRLIPDEKAAEIVKLIFDLYLKGMSKRGIALHLNDLGILNPTRYKKACGLNYKNPHSTGDCSWSERTIAQILANEMYLGHMIQGKYKLISETIKEQIQTPKEEWFRVENTHQALISQEIFELAAQKIQKDLRVSAPKKRTHLFAGVLKCADCGRSMSSSLKKDRVYYVCGTYKHISSKACSRHTIREDVLAKIVLEQIQAQIAAACQIDRVLAELNSKPPLPPKTLKLSALLNEKKSQLKESQKMQVDCYKDLKRALISEAQYLLYLKDLEEDEQRLQKIIQNLEGQIAQAPDGEGENQFIFNFKQTQNISALDHLTISCLIEKICIHEDKIIDIYFNFTL